MVRTKRTPRYRTKSEPKTLFEQVEMMLQNIKWINSQYEKKGEKK
ncbi:hypothetical protein BAXH7_03151 [Bacillus amyloliquefaciens XH7]|nr:hypothetical protein [Bacillus amyloliquefaciens]AEB25241.1 hypothetical protein BAMTA208_15420 [Bacillus amyloliquefaciens TA208]AEK90271.1 hypothetical protein BAXH7_03151 [Bacillus amyloliquefaciens XH7]